RPGQCGHSVPTARRHHHHRSPRPGSPAPDLPSAPKAGQRMTTPARRTAVITGAASGIGHVTAGRLAEAGYRVFGWDRTSTGRPDDAVVDITDPTSITEAVAALNRATDHLDLLVNVAGTGAVGTVENTTEDDWHRVLEVNVIGTARVTAALLP